MAKRKKRKTEKTKNFPLQPKKKSKIGLTTIKVIGVGGCGGNAVTRMMNSERMRGVEFIAINSDAQDLNHVQAHQKLYIGRALTKGLGTGMNPEIGKQATEESRSEIAEAIEGADIVFITAGMGGGQGTGGSPVVAEIAREKGILTVAVVTKPFTFEGAQRVSIAQEGLAQLKSKVDALIVIPNDKIFSLIDKDTSLTKAFSYIDDVLRNAVQAITELINAPGIINVDFADIKTIMKDAGTAIIGIGLAAGPDRGLKAVQAAVNSPLLEISLDGAKGVLFSVAGGRDLKMAEINEIAKAVSSNLDSNAKIIFGAYHDSRIKDRQIKVTVIATGFNGLLGNRLPTPSLFVHHLNEEKKSTVGVRDSDRDIVDEKPAILISPKTASKKSDSWEVPAFLRKKKK